MRPKNKDVCPAAKKKKVPEERSLETIISLASLGLNSYSEEVRKYLISLAKDDWLEQHQTKGSITKLADELLVKLRRTQ